MPRAVITIDGYVQRVGYRYKVAYIAKRYNLKGHIKNLDDGKVEIIVEGNKDDIESFITDINIKEHPVYVESIDVNYQEAKNEFKTFKIVTGSLEDEMIEGFGTGALYLDNIMQTQKKMLEKQDSMLEKQDKTIESLEDIKSKQDSMLEKQDKTIDEIRNLREDLSSMLDIRLKRIEEDMAKVKAKLGLG